MPTSKETFSLGIDIGATKMLASVISSSGNVVSAHSIPTERDRLVDSVKGIIAQFESRLALTSIGIAVAGQVDRKQGIIHFLPNLQIKNLPLIPLLSPTTKTPIALMNDVYAAATAEVILGSARGLKNGIFVLLGTGIGGALLIDGKIYSGEKDTAGEIGHLGVNFSGPPCSCGSNGCLEVYSSGWGMAERGGFSSGKDAFEKGDDKLIEEAFRALVYALSGLANVINPEKILLGGGLLQGYLSRIPHFLQELKKGISRHALPNTTSHISFEEVHFRENGPSIGAALGSREQL